MTRVLVAGEAEGPALVLDEALSFWGGLDAASGKIIDRHHPQRGARVSGAILVMPSGRGSSSSSSTLAEALRRRTGPAGIVLAEADGIVALGALVAGDLYGTSCPVIVVPADAYGSLRMGQRIAVSRDGAITTQGPPAASR